jgi:hypothetical protein
MLETARYTHVLYNHPGNLEKNVICVIEWKMFSYEW